jgi:hypothetical protein
MPLPAWVPELLEGDAAQSGAEFSTGLLGVDQELPLALRP